MRIAYIISAYRYPQQLTRLVSMLNIDTTSLFIHVDKRTDILTYGDMVRGLGSFPNVHFLKRHKCHWGGFGHVAATLEGISEILKTGTSFDYAVLLTGQDYPIKTNHYIAAFFEEHKGALFLDFSPLPNEVWRNRGMVGGMERIEAWHWHIFNRHIWFPPNPRCQIKRRFPTGLKPYGGSSHWCLPRECIEYVYELTTRKRALVSFFRYVDVPDEIFFQTIILNSPFAKKVTNDNLRYIDWRDPNAGSPAILRKSDLDNLLSSPKLFARKFDQQVDAEVQDLIDQQLLADA